MNPATPPIELQPLLERFGNDVTRLMQSLQNGVITADEWYSEMRRLLVRYHVSAMQAGTGLTTLPEGADDLLVKSLEFQDEYLDNFRMVIQAAPDFNPAWIARALMYVNSIKSSFWEGEVYRQVGRFLPIPSVPGDGTTQCLSNCLCSLDIQTVNADNGDYNVTWQRHAQDSCQTCIERGDTWNPLKIRNGVLQL